MSECKSCSGSPKSSGKKSAQLPLGAGHAKKEALKAKGKAIGKKEQAKKG